MEQTTEEIIDTPIEVHKLKPNMEDYDDAYTNFKWDSVKENFSWHTTGKVNMAYEAIDRHAESWRRNKVALYYDTDGRKEKYTFQELKLLSNKFANVLKKLGVKKGDRIAVFMPRSPELYAAFIGIAKIGAISMPMFEAFMEEAIRDRMQDSEAVAMITTPAMRGRISQDKMPALKHLIMLGEQDQLEEGEVNYQTEMDQASDKFNIEWLDLEDGLILHYTSGSTGKPKGVLHAQRAMIGHYHTAKNVLDLHEEDLYWCTADPGWVTGTSYGIYGPWLHGASSLIKGGRFSADAWYKTIEEYKVTIWYSAPTAFRLLMSKGNEKVAEYDLSSLRLIYSVGEPLNPEVIRWGLKVFHLPIYENWWMTETGMQLIGNYPALALKPGSMGKPVPGITAAIIDDDGKVVPPLTIGNLAIKSGWPAMMHSIWKNEEKFKSYFVKGDDDTEWYVSGDSAYMDEEGYVWFQGRIDDVIKTSGERVGPFEVESKLVEHPAVAEAGVIGKPDDIRGSIIKAFISLRPGFKETPELLEEIRVFVKMGLAAHAAPREIEVVDKLPKTRSGKIMRRVLKAKELGLPTGDLSTIDDD